MKAVILAGGYGSRLGDLTKVIPKPIIPIGNTSVLEHTVKRLKKAGIVQIIVKVHYLPDKIMERLGENVLYYYEPLLFPHFETIKNLEPWLTGEEFLVINGDTISDVNYEEMISLHKFGTITALMDEWRCAGTWVYSSTVFSNSKPPVIPYRPKLTWFDTGTPERLRLAKEHFNV